MNKKSASICLTLIFSVFLFLPLQLLAQVSDDACSLDGSCDVLPVLISSDTADADSVANDPFLSTDKVNLPVGHLKAVIISGDGPYVVVGNSAPTVASTSVYDGFLSIKALASGNTVIKVCRAHIVDAVCEEVSVTVVAPEVKPEKQMLGGANSMKSAKYKFTKKLQLGSVGDEVSELQKRLQAERLYVGKIMGRFDANTRTALKKYQKIKKISQVGILGPLTRASLNK